MATQQEIADVFGVRRDAVARWPVDHNDLRQVLIYTLNRKNRRGRQMPPPAEWVPALWDLEFGSRDVAAPLPEGELPLDWLARQLMAGLPLPPDISDDRVQSAARAANQMSLSEKRNQDRELASGSHALKGDVRSSLAEIYTAIRTVLGDELVFRLRDHPPKGLRDSRALVHDLAGRLITALNEAEAPYL